MLNINARLKSEELSDAISRVWKVAAPKIAAIDASFQGRGGAPVFTINGVYESQGWTEWTQGFQFGCAALLFDATDDEQFLQVARQATCVSMSQHVTHFGVHDHGFNNVSTYGNLRRLMLEDRISLDDFELRFYEMALCASASVQAARWSETSDGDGFIYSFNGPHSLFCDTIRSLRVLSLGYKLGHAMMGENDRRISLLDRMLQHARSTARYNVYFGESRDIYDRRGRVAHESIFNVNDGNYRCPSTQQGYSPFSTWTRGLAWVMLGFPEQLEFLETISEGEADLFGGLDANREMMVRTAKASCDFYLHNVPIDGIPYWDTGAPGLAEMPGFLDRLADPFNDHEPVDSSAAAIGAQGLLRLGRYLTGRGDSDGQRYWQAGLTVLETLLSERYLSTRDDHQGMLLHSVYHRPRGWDHCASGTVPRGESSMWGDYHLLECCLYLQRVNRGQSYYSFFAPTSGE